MRSDLMAVGNHADPSTGNVMKKTALLAAAAMIAGVGFAAAQQSGSTTSPDPNKCWDVSTNMIKEKSAAPSGTTGSAASGATAGTSPSGSPGSTAGSAGSSTSSGTVAAARPAGMPSC